MAFHFLFFSLLFFHGAALAHDGSGLFSFAGSAGAVVALVVAILSIWRGFVKRKSAWDMAFSVLISSILAFVLVAVCCVAFYVLSAIFIKSRLQDESKKNADATKLQWQQNPLRIAACAADLPALEMALEHATEEKDRISGVVEECAVKSANTAVMKVLLQHKLKQRSGEGNNRADLHCAYLAPAMAATNVALLEVFVEQGLKLDCSDYGGPMWWRGLSAAHSLPAHHVLAWLHYLQSHELDLREQKGDRSLLSSAMRSLHAPVILFALDLGMDPYADAGANYYGLSMMQYWTIRRFDEGSATSKAQLTMEEKNTVQARLRELTAVEANFQHAHTSSRFKEWDHLSDGGAALFAYLLERGAAVRLDQGGGSMVDGYRSTSPQLIAVLDSLSDEQLRLLSCPGATSGQRRTLYDDARGARNHSLLQFLERRKMQHACS
ncbi:hypothetical protein [Undibacterium umbellatum]|uniref:Uncharacterized protein n=1 Tax=Undibacterium umbellatum TaxID=2762300 RepID=A0ABR6Z6B3_9BURK|nr:hypothetical protein [Undibacterium umbellatum]MBC3907318.1 hypothetical protein [Undibacterium umbellatum]